MNDTSCRGVQPLMRFAAALLLLCALLIAGSPARALEGDDGVFDPSSIIKVGSTYHIFCDGTGIVHKTSTDMVSWTTVGNVLGTGNGPSWIQTYVPGFTGYFWAPEITTMGGKYYIYYACGGETPATDQCIGCATSTDLVNWTDQGLVVAATPSTTWGGIDPSVCEDASGNYWMTWGSWRQGIYDAQLNPTTGKFLNSTKTNIVNITDAEASKMIYHDGYYYCFFNQGTCCVGITSTYTIWVARSTSPTGPFTGAAVFIASAAPIYAPGQLGYFDDNGTEYVTFHYDDGNSNGYPRLFISHLTWSNNWPVNNPNWIANGTYRITNTTNGLGVTGGTTGASLQAVTENTYTAATNQKWVFTNLGWNLYKITNADGGLALDALDCSNANGTLMDLYAYWGGTCQQYNIYHENDGTYAFATYNGGGNGTDVLDIPNGVSTLGTQLDLWAYNGLWTQKWTVSTP